MASVSLSKLDLSFLRKNDPDSCQPGRYRLDTETGELIPAADHARKYRRPSKHSEAVGLPYFMPDVDAAYGGAWKSVIDGREISSRSNWREHDKRNGVINVGSDYWAKDGDDVAYTEKKMGYDPSLIGKKDTGDGVSFSWGKRS